VALLAFKKERRMEVWAGSDGAWRFVRAYPILGASGELGPKLREGDRQVPEGIYRVEGLNPNSSFHLSMKLDYPNAFDRKYALHDGRMRPGSDIFIHGKATSVGCLAMGDEAIEELFVLVHDVGVENVRVIIAPTDPRMTPLNSRGHPAWVDELYRQIEDEFRRYSHQGSWLGRSQPAGGDRR
jgi:murein L,D-transpeptidase YafK